MKIRQMGAELVHADGWTDMTKLIVAFRNFLYIFSKNTQILNFVKIRSVGAELIHADGRTDGYDEADSRFSQFSLQIFEK
jgi:hypothetical protein